MMNIALRDYFAGEDMKAILGSRENRDQMAMLAVQQGQATSETVAENSYVAADAMMKARVKGRPAGDESVSTDREIADIVEEIVARHFRVRVELIEHKTRDEEAVVPRHICMYLLGSHLI